MKTFAILSAAIVLGLPALAADSAPAATPPGSVTTTTEITTTPAADMFVMASGSVLAIRGKESARLVADTKLGDGSLLTPGGTVRRVDGTSVTLADGQAITIAGTISAAPAGAVTDTNTVVTEVPAKVR